MERGDTVYFCYIDEAGCPGALPASNSPVQPSLTLCGLIVSAEHVSPITDRFMRLKSNYDPSLTKGLKHYLDVTRKELKGSDLRKEIRKRGRNRRRYVFRFIDSIVELLEV